MKRLKNLLRLCAPYKRNFVIVTFFSAVFVFCSLCLPLMFGKIIDCITDNGEPIDVKRIIKYCGVCGVLVAVGFLAQRINNLINNSTSYGVVRDLRGQLFEKIQRLPIKVVDRDSSGETVSKIVSDADRIGEGLLMTFEQLFTGALTIVCIVVILFLKELSLYKVPYITILVLVLTPLSVFIAKYISKRSSKYFKDRARVNGEQTAFINEIVTNEKTVKAFNREQKVLDDFERINEQNRVSSLKATFYSSTVNPTTRFVYNVIYACICLLGAHLIISDKNMGVGDLFVFLSYVNQYTKPFNEISGVLTELQYSMACADRIAELLDEEEETNPQKSQTFSGVVEFDGVCFSYVKGKDILKDLTFKVERGKKIAIVGPTGCGKTTLMNLLVRFYDPDSGVIKFDGKDISGYNRSSIRSNIGMVLQDCFVFTGTVYENVSLGKPNATKEEIIAACKKSYAHSFISRLPNGYDTVIGEKQGLSQGEKQLLSIARIMLLDPPVLILDEATSSIDFRTELKITKAIRALAKGKTVFTVAHRLSTIKSADTILVLKGGVIAECGTHDHLMEQDGFYKELYNSQFD